jgi:hypothetical protein
MLRSRRKYIIFSAYSKCARGNRNARTKDDKSFLISVSTIINWQWLPGALEWQGFWGHIWFQWKRGWWSIRSGGVGWEWKIASH